MKAIILIFFLMPLASHALIDCDLLKIKIEENLEMQRLLASKAPSRMGALNKGERLAVALDYAFSGKSPDKYIEKKYNEKNVAYARRMDFLKRELLTYMSFSKRCPL